jgi:hypothetical protein
LQRVDDLVYERHRISLRITQQDLPVTHRAVRVQTIEQPTGAGVAENSQMSERAAEPLLEVLSVRERSGGATKHIGPGTIEIQYRRAAAWRPACAGTIARLERRMLAASG